MRGLLRLLVHHDVVGNVSDWLRVHVSYVSKIVYWFDSRETRVAL